MIGYGAFGRDSHTTLINSTISPDEGEPKEDLLKGVFQIMMVMM